MAQGHEKDGINIARRQLALLHYSALLDNRELYALECERSDMPGIKVRDGEPIDKVLRIFKKQVEKAGVIGDLKKNQHYEKPSVKRKKKAIAARKRRIKQLRKMGR